ncbi:DUF1015 domain-containing protein [Streptomyces sp. NBC_00160]|uniref:DUF1015 domain-containing protein n=1 Tax=Streptomyces sp. NBC_00160 TaxID=2903628 RepID=UPI002259B80C|nr:DUF1015 domain-containing protein [Streptomyces sp. NBC_00160]MCX5302747.1 DUF1015 domain-containing protein [Streptomyces sp. NBC_00160]
MPSPPAPPSTGLRIQPFRAVRYDPVLAGDLSHVVCPPYDDMAPAHARALRRRPHHLARLLYAHDPNEAAGQLDRWLRRGVLRRDARPALYVYQQQRGARITQRGLIGELDLHQDAAEWILPHEDVRPHAVAQRAALMAGTHAQLEPLLMTYRSTKSAAAQIVHRATGRPPVAVARSGALTHTLWACTDPVEQSLITSGLSGCRALIADGHHRYAASLRLRDRMGPGPWDRTLALLVDSTTGPLRLNAIHRVIPALEPDKAAAAAAEVARVRPLPEGPRLPGPGELVLAGGGDAWSVTDPDPGALGAALAGRPSQWHGLAAAVADRLLLATAWSVPDLPGAVLHLHDAGEAEAVVRTPGNGTAVLLPAVSEDTVWDLATAGVMLPRKSTSFGPKPIAGLALRVFDPAA